MPLDVNKVLKPNVKNVSLCMAYCKLKLRIERIYTTFLLYRIAFWSVP